MNQEPEIVVDSPAPPATNADDLWTRMMEDVRARFPHVSDGIAFCILKLEQNADQRLRDFQAEAKLHGLKITGRAFHSAKVALGLEPPSVRRPRAVAATATTDPAEPQPPAAPATPIEDESPALAALRAFERASTQEIERLRALVRAVREIVDEALAE